MIVIIIIIIIIKTYAIVCTSQQQTWLKCGLMKKNWPYSFKHSLIQPVRIRRVMCLSTVVSKWNAHIEICLLLTILTRLYLMLNVFCNQSFEVQFSPLVIWWLVFHSNNAVDWALNASQLINVPPPLPTQESNNVKKEQHAKREKSSHSLGFGCGL